MKRNLLLTLSFCIVSILSYSQSARLVLLEEFTQASCPPCEATAPALKAITDANLDKVVSLRYHTSFPGVDPMNADNPTDVLTRRNYYGVNGVPTFLIDGIATTSNSVPTQGGIDNASSQNAPVLLSLSHSVAEDLSTIDVELVITNEGSDMADLSALTLRVAVAEREVNWPFRPGSTSIQDFEYVMKSFVTTVEGMDVDNIPAGESLTLNWTTDMPATVYDYNELMIVGFLQNDTNRRISQAGMSEPIELSGYPDFSVAGSAETQSSLCDLSFVPTATVTNETSETYSDITVSLVFNGDVVEEVVYTDPIMPGAEVSIPFTTDQLPAGTTTYFYTVESNAAQDVATLNDITTSSSVSKIDASVSSTSAELDFEDSNVNFISAPEGLIIEKPFDQAIGQINGDWLRSTAPIGAFAESDRSLYFFFWAWNPATVDDTGIVYLQDQIEVPASGAVLTFDHAYTSFSGSQDRLIINVSSDCGETSTEVFNKAGADLRTSPEVNSGTLPFAPTTADDWLSNEIDLSAFAGQSVLISFQAVSQWGDNLYVDNISVSSLSSINDLTTGESIDVYPNPVNDLVSVDFTIAEKSNTRVSITNSLGQQVFAKNLGENIGTFIERINVSNLESGIYNMYIQLDDREVVKRFIKQ